MLEAMKWNLIIWKLILYVLLFIFWLIWTHFCFPLSFGGGVHRSISCCICGLFCPTPWIFKMENYKTKENICSSMLGKMIIFHAHFMLEIQYQSKFKYKNSPILSFSITGEFSFKCQDENQFVFLCHNKCDCVAC